MLSCVHGDTRISRWVRQSTSLMHNAARHRPAGGTTAALNAAGAELPIVKLKNLDQNHKTVLCLDGGGMRGLLTVSLMESLVDVLKAELVAAANSPDKATADRFQATEGNINDVNDFDVDLGDYFDVLSGTSTGSIIATYLAARGAKSTAIVKEAQQVLRASHPQFKDLRPGSVRAGQAIFLYAADTIFARGKPGSVVSSFLASSVFAEILRKHLPPIPLLSAALQFLVRGLFKLLIQALSEDAARTLDKMVKPGYGDEGIRSILQRVYDGAEGRTSGNKHREASLANGLKTSLLIPTFQMSALKQDPQGRGKEIADPAIAGARRPFSFFYLRNEDRADPTPGSCGYEESWGYSSIARLMSSGEVSIADRTQLDKYGRRIKSAKGPRSTLACNSDNGSGATNGAQALHQQEAMRSTAEIVYRFGLDFALKDVVRSSAAAPTYFPPAQVCPVADTTSAKGSAQDDLTYVLCDGGVVANNPSAEALAFTSIAYGDEKGLWDLKKIAVLSLGTGISIAPARVNQEYAGAGSWLLLDGPLLDVLTGGSQELSTALETTDMLASGHYTEGQISRVQLACQWDPKIKTVAQDGGQGDGSTCQPGWQKLFAHLNDPNSLLAGRMVPDIWLENPFPAAGKKEPRGKQLSDILTNMDQIEDRWYLYRLGQELGNCDMVKKTFTTFVRKYVLNVDKDAAADKPGGQQQKKSAQGAKRMQYASAEP